MRGTEGRKRQVDIQPEEYNHLDESSDLTLVSCAPAGDHRLSLLLSQAMGSQHCRDLLALQLADWNRMQNDCYLSEERLRIFALLAGKPVRLVALFFFFFLCHTVLTSTSLSDVTLFCCCCRRCGSRPTQSSMSAPSWTGNAPWPSTCGLCCLRRLRWPTPSPNTRMLSR